MKLCNRCDWAPGDPEDDGPAWSREELRELLLEHAETAEHPLCIRCRRRSLHDYQKQVCDECLQAVREDLAGILEMWIELRSHLGHAVSQVYDANRGGKDSPLPGGDVLVLLGPGSAGAFDNHETVKKGDVPSIAYVLAGWHRVWSAHRGEPVSDLDNWVAPGRGGVIYAAAGYLERHALWASNNVEAFATYAEDLASLHARLAVATGRSRQPMTTGATCFTCGGDLVWPVDRDTGLATDTLRCQRCGERSNVGQYLMAKRATRDTQLDGWLSVTDAAAASFRTRDTIWSWVRRGVVNAAQYCTSCSEQLPFGPLTEREATSHLVRMQVWWPDVAERAKAAEYRAPRRRKPEQEETG